MFIMTNVERYAAKTWANWHHYIIKQMQDMLTFQTFPCPHKYD